MFTVAHHYCPLQSPAGLFRGLHKPSGRRRRNEHSAAGGAKVYGKCFDAGQAVIQSRNRKIPPLFCAAGPRLRRGPAPLVLFRGFANRLTAFRSAAPRAIGFHKPKQMPRLVSLRGSGSPAVCLHGSASPGGLASQLGKPALPEANTWAALVFPRHRVSPSVCRGLRKPWRSCSAAPGATFGVSLRSPGSPAFINPNSFPNT